MKRIWLVGAACLALATLAAGYSRTTAAGLGSASAGSIISAASPPLAASTATQTILVLPGQFLVEGSGIRGVPATQKAGRPFPVDVYTVDDSFVVDAAAAGPVRVVTEDPNDIEPPQQHLRNGHAALSLTPVTASTTGWTATAMGGPGSSRPSAAYLVVADAATQTVAVLPGQTLIEGVGIVGRATAQAVNVPFHVHVYAVDRFLNVDTTAVGTVTLTTSDPFDLEAKPLELAGGRATFAVNPAAATITGASVALSGGPGANTSSDLYPVLEDQLTGTTVYVDPLTQTVSAGSEFDVSIVVADVTNLGAFEFTLASDPALIQFVGISPGPFLGSTGRPVNCMAPLLTESSVRFTCVTLGAEPDGPSGSGVLATAQFSAVSAGTSVLDLQDVILLTPNASRIPVDQVIDGSVTVQIVPTPTPTPVLTPTSTATVDPLETPSITPTPTITSTRTSTPTRTPTRTPTPTPPPTKVRVDPVAQNASVRDDFTVDIRVDDVVNLGAYQFKLGFDPAIVAFVSVTNGDFLGSSGRPVDCQAPILTASSVRFSCSTRGADLPGASGSGVLATVRLNATVAGTSLLDLQDVILLTPDAKTIAVDEVMDGSVTTVPPTPTSTPTITPTPTATATLDPAVTPTTTSTPTLTPTATVTRTPTLTPTRTSTPGPTTVRIEPTTQDVPQFYPFTVDVLVENLVNLGAYQFTLAFDPSLVGFAGVTNGAFLGSTGRPVDCQAPILTASTVRFSCSTRGADIPGPSGSGVLATLAFDAVGGGTGILDLQDVILLHPDATRITVDQIVDGSVTVIPGPSPTPTVSPTPTDTPEPGAATPTPTRTPTRTPTPPAGSPTATPVPAVVAVDPSSQSAAVDQQFTVDITVENVTNLGSYEWKLEFDPAIIGYVSVANGPFLGSTGRPVFCLSPILDEGSVRFGCVTSGPEPPGPNGAGVLSTVTFQGLAEGTSALHFGFVSLSTPLGDDIYAVSNDGSVTVTSGGGGAAVGPADGSGGAGDPLGYLPQDSSSLLSAEASAQGHGDLFVRIVAVMGMAAGLGGVAVLLIPTVGALVSAAQEKGRATAPGARRRYHPTRLTLRLTLPSPALPEWPSFPRPSAARLGMGSLSLALLTACATLFVAGGAAMEPFAADNGVPVFKNPAEITLFLRPDSEVVITEEVTNVPEPGLGGFELGILYDRSIIDLSIQEGLFLGSTGRTTTCNAIWGESYVRFWCASSGTQPGPTGSGTLANLFVRPNPDLRIRPTAGNGVLTLLDNDSAETELVEPLGGKIPVSSVGDSLLTVRALEGDLNLDCIVNVIDEQDIAWRYQAIFGSLAYDIWYDLEPPQGDFDIDIKDLQFVFGRHGWKCPSPTPTPTPTPTPPKTATPTATATLAPTATATSTPTATATLAPTATATSTPTATATLAPTATATSTPTATATLAPATTATSTPTGTTMPTVTRTPTMTAIPTVTRTPAVTSTASATATAALSGTPTRTPTVTGTPVTVTATSTAIPTHRRTATASPAATATGVSQVIPTTPTPISQAPTSTGTPVGEVLPAITPPARVLPPTGSGPGNGWTPQTTAAAGILAAVGLTLLLLSLRRRPSGDGQ